MLVPNQTFLVKINSNNLELYKSKGYECNKGDEIIVRAEDLTKGSHQKVKIICDGCGEESEVEYRQYLKSNHDGKTYCCKCKHKYVISKTNLERYGYKCPSQNEEIKKKVKSTNLKRYGCEYALSSGEIRKKIAATNLEKYGVENVFSNERIKDRIKETIREKYGCDSIMQSAEIREKISQTNLEKYGVENVFANKKVQEKIKATNIEKYGVSVPSKSEKVKEKMKNTMLERYGVEYSMQSDELLAKAKKTFYKNNSIATSAQQKEIYKMLTNIFVDEDIQINYPYSRCSLDIALFIDNKKIDIEYDGWYWHQDKKKDMARDEFLKSNGWKILRIKGSYKIPTEEQLKEAIDRIIEEKYSYTEIILDDWDKLSKIRKEENVS